MKSFTLQDIDELTRRFMTVHELVCHNSYLYNKEGFINDFFNDQELVTKWAEITFKGDKLKTEKRLHWGKGSIFEKTNFKKIQMMLSELNEFVKSSKIELNQINSLDDKFAIDPEQPIPFEDLLFPIVVYARKKLFDRLLCGFKSNDIEMILSKSALGNLERSLLKILSLMSSAVLYKEFCKNRTYGQNLLNSLFINSGKALTNELYKKFCEKNTENGYKKLFMIYPVLARILITRTLFWIDSCYDFITRFAKDQDLIKQQFNIEVNCRNTPLIREIDSDTSDFHNNGRSVFLIRFENGTKIVYKPRDLNPEMVLNSFFIWLKDLNNSIKLKTRKIIPMDGYGWSEFINHIPCENHDEMKMYYEQMGVLIFVSYFLNITDLHHENVIAHGISPTIVDAETIMHPTIPIIENSTISKKIVNEKINELAKESVLTSHLLPLWYATSNGKSFDISAIGFIGQQQNTSISYKVWKNINTDDMHFKYKDDYTYRSKNSPFSEGMEKNVSNYLDDICNSFSSTYMFFLKNKSLVLDKIKEFENVRIRYVFRASRVYSVILRKSYEPEFLTSGLFWGMQLDQVSRAFLSFEKKPPIWCFLIHELEALKNLDIPAFEILANQGELETCYGSKVGFEKLEKPIDKVYQKLDKLSENDMQLQGHFIKNALA